MTINTNKMGTIPISFLCFACVCNFTAHFIEYCSHQSCLMLIITKFRPKWTSLNRKFRASWCYQHQANTSKTSCSKFQANLSRIDWDMTDLICSFNDVCFCVWQGHMQNTIISLISLGGFSWCLQQESA